jgi:hypothetical protein
MGFVPSGEWKPCLSLAAYLTTHEMAMGGMGELADFFDNAKEGLHKVGADGTANVDYTDARLRLEGAHGILGRGVIVHANPDDFKTQPTGNAGGRVACGVIGVAKGE